MKISIFYSLSLIEASLISNAYTDHFEIQQLAKFSANPVFPGFNQQLVFELAKDGFFDIAQKISKYARSENASRKIRNRQRRNYKNYLRHFERTESDRSWKFLWKRFWTFKIAELKTLLIIERRLKFRLFAKYKNFEKIMC